MEEIINRAWDDKSLLQDEKTLAAIRKVIDQLTDGTLRVAEKKGNEWVVNEWVKKAILLYFPIQKVETIDAFPFQFNDKIPLQKGLAEREFRVVPGAIARHGAYIGRNVILMPSFMNIGAYVDDGTMVDTWVTVGSGAQIGKPDPSR